MKNIIFLTGTRADFGKIKSLIQILQNSKEFNPYVFVTGMHLMHDYGYTLIEIERCGFKNIFTFENHTSETTMELTLAKTIQGFSAFVQNNKPDLIVIHGDRVEALAGAIVGSLNNILVAHIEGGEISGTIDELIRHATSKMSHIHFVANDSAKQRLVQMGELSNAIAIIGSPDVDVMFSDSLPNLTKAKDHYEVDFKDYAIAMFHPVTTEVERMSEYTDNFVKALIESRKNYIVVYPNNDMGSQYIIDSYKLLSQKSNFRVFPSLRFEYFLTFLKYAQFIVGNSSAGIREAPLYGVPAINIGTRQANRAIHSQIINVDYEKQAILEAINSNLQHHNKKLEGYGDGKSAEKFLQSLKAPLFWKINHQKQFNDYQSIAT